MRAALGLDVGNRARQIYFRGALQDVERGRAKFPLTTDDVSRLEVPFDDRILVQLQKSSGNVLENGQADENFRIDSRTFEVGGDHATVRQRSRGAGHHALAAGNARGLSHGQVGIEGDACLISLAPPRQHPVVADAIAAANAAIAKDASLMVDFDG